MQGGRGGGAGEEKKKAKRPAQRVFPHTLPPSAARASAAERDTRGRASDRAPPPRRATHPPRRSWLLLAGPAGGGGGASAARALWRPHGPFRCLPPSGFDRGETEIACVLTCGSGRRIGRAARAPSLTNKPNQNQKPQPQPQPKFNFCFFPEESPTPEDVTQSKPRCVRIRRRYPNFTRHTVKNKKGRTCHGRAPHQTDGGSRSGLRSILLG